jgi:hypothetical protein
LRLAVFAGIVHRAAQRRTAMPTTPQRCYFGYVEVDMAFSSPTREARAAACKASATKADERALALAPIITEIRASGITTPYAIAAALTARGVRTARGHRVWTETPVRQILNRLNRLVGVTHAKTE